MMNVPVSRRRPLQFVAFACGTLFVLAQFSLEALAERKITRIVESWEVKLKTAQPSEGLPTITHVISPVTACDGEHALFLVNYADTPTSETGGMQVQSWFGEQFVEENTHRQSFPLSENNEVVKYEISMEIIGEHVVVEIQGGSSRTWGSFGGEGYMKVVMPTKLTDLNEYRPLFSVLSSEVRGAHNIDKASLVSTKFYSSKKLVATDKSTKDLHIFHPYLADVTLADYAANPDAYNHKID